MPFQINWHNYILLSLFPLRSNCMSEGSVDSELNGSCRETSYNDPPHLWRPKLFWFWCSSHKNTVIFHSLRLPFLRLKGKRHFQDAMGCLFTCEAFHETLTCTHCFFSFQSEKTIGIYSQKVIFQRENCQARGDSLVIWTSRIKLSLGARESDLSDFNGTEHIYIRGEFVLRVCMEAQIQIPAATDKWRVDCQLSNMREDFLWMLA